MKYNTAKRKRWREKCRRGGINSGIARRAKMMEREPELRPRAIGEFIGTLDIRLGGEPVRRYTLRQGKRRNNLNISLGDKVISCGWDKLLSGLREKLAPITRQLSGAI